MPRIRAIRVIFALLFAPGSSAFPHPPQKSAVVLSGTIFSEGTSRRIARANTTLCDNGGAPLQQSAASDDREFSFQGISPGRYILKVQAMGFEPAQLPVDLSSTSQRGFSVMLTPVLIAKQPGSQGQTISAHELSMPMASRELLASGKKKLYTDKNGQAALRDFQSAMQKSGNCYEAYYLAGMAYLSLQNPVEAENHFRKSAELSENQYADADIALGMLLLQRHEAHDGEAFAALRAPCSFIAHSAGSFQRLVLAPLPLCQGFSSKSSSRPSSFAELTHRCSPHFSHTQNGSGVPQ